MSGAAAEVYAGEIIEVVQSVFETMVGLAAEPCAALWSPGADRLTAVVHLAGEWNGAVLLECSCGQACRFAARFLSIEPPAGVDDVVRDVLGELANMIGGNLKCVLTRGIRLSMPSVVDGNDYSLRVCGARLRERLAFRCAEGLFWVMLLSTRA